MPHEYLEDTAIADIAFRAWGTSLGETFASAVDATLNVMIEELESIRPVESRDIRLENDALDMLLFDLLQEIVYYKDAALLLLRVLEPRIQQKNGGVWELEACAIGETLDPNRHRQRVDVKAVTLHRFAVERTESGWQAFVILDV